MLVRCVSTRLSDDQIIQLKMASRHPEYQLKVGVVYLVLGITFSLPEPFHGGGVQYEILNDFGRVRSIPACLFELEDNRCSRYWIAQKSKDGALLLWPEEFLSQYFHDDLSEGVPEVRQVFDLVVQKMRAEAADGLENHARYQDSL